MGIGEPKRLAFSEEEYLSRLERVQNELTARGLDGLLSVSPENLTYVSGYQTFGYYRWQGMLVLSTGEPTLVVRALELPNVEEWCWFRDAVGIGENEDAMEVLARVLREHGLDGMRVGIELDSWFITNRQFSRLRELCAGIEFVDSGGLIEEIRLIKSPAEISRIRDACRQAEAMIRAGWESVEVGRRESDVAAAALVALALSNGELAGLPPFIVSGPRTAIPHATWSDRVLSTGDPIVMEVAGSSQRYSGALARTAFVNRAEPTYLRISEVCVKALEAALECAGPGVPASAVDRAVKDVLLGASLGEARGEHRAGYSIGISWPPDWGEGNSMDLSAREHRILRPGMTFHLTGSLVFAAERMIGLSETVMITEAGSESLIGFPREFPIL